MARQGKASVAKPDPWLRYGGKVPVGTIPAAARPAPSSSRQTPGSPEHQSVDAAVAAGAGFYDWPSVCSLLNVDDAHLASAVAAKTVLCMRDGEGTPVFPAWQFTTSNEVLPFLSTLIQALARGIDDPRTWALWLTSPTHRDGRTAVEMLAAGADPRPLLAQAQHDAARWTS